MPRGDNLIPFRFQPGQSGNPSGRRSDKSLVDYVLKTTRGGVELADALLDIARSARKASDRIDAIQVLLDRCYGKVPSSDRPSLLIRVVASPAIETRNLPGLRICCTQPHLGDGLLASTIA